MNKKQKMDFAYVRKGKEIKISRKKNVKVLKRKDGCKSNFTNKDGFVVALIQFAKRICVGILKTAKIPIIYTSFIR